MIQHCCSEQPSVSRDSPKNEFPSTERPLAFISTYCASKHVIFFIFFLHRFFQLYQTRAAIPMNAHCTPYPVRFRFPPLYLSDPAVQQHPSKDKARSESFPGGLEESIRSLVAE